MSKFAPLTESTYQYLLSISSRESNVLERLRQETAALPNASMQISPDQGQFMGLLVRLMGAKKTLEIGVFTGYSSLSVALALPDDGKIVACDVSEEWTGIARRYWKEADVEQKINLRIAPAIQTLDSLIAAGQSGTFDFAFIDADKANYGHYYDAVFTLMRPGGLIAVDNVLWSGKVIDATVTDPDTEALRAFNKKLAQDNRVTLCILTIGDGLTLAVKK